MLGTRLWPERAAARAAGSIPQPAGAPGLVHPLRAALGRVSHTLALEQVYATILYYLRNRAQLDAYLAEWLAFSQQAREAQTLNPPPAILHLPQRKAEQQPVE